MYTSTSTKVGPPTWPCPYLTPIFSVHNTEVGRLEGRVREYVREVEVKRLALIEAPRQWGQEEAGEMAATAPGQGLGPGGASTQPMLALGMSGSVTEGEAHY